MSQVDPEIQFLSQIGLQSSPLDRTPNLQELMDDIRTISSQNYLDDSSRRTALLFAQTYISGVLGVKPTPIQEETNLTKEQKEKIRICFQLGEMPQCADRFITILEAKAVKLRCLLFDETYTLMKIIFKDCTQEKVAKTARILTEVF